MKKFILILIVLMVLFSCGKQEKSSSSTMKGVVKNHNKPLAWGKKQKIYVFADDNVWKYAEEKLRQTIERTYYTTTNEKMFVLERISFSKLEDYFRFNNLIFCSNASSDQEVSKYVKERLGSEIDARIAADGGAIYPVYNLWADDQLVLFIVGETEERLLKLNILHAPEIWKIFKQRLYKRIESQVYSFRRKPMSNFTEKIWQLDLPDRYVKYREDNWLSIVF
jgi:hypothetical protein